MSSPKNAPTSRMPLVDALKAGGSQLIVLHHLSAYGPLAEAMQDAAPGLMDWLFDYARMAVQVFLVIGGFLAARSLAPRREAAFGDPLALVGKRYLRLVVPYLAAVSVAIACAALARQWLADDFIPDAPRFGQWLAHALLLHSVLGYDALSAGVWYVAIDFQLFALMAASLWLGRRAGLGGYAPALPLVFAVAALFWFNRDASWDNWALYFFGSYGLGAAAYWASGRGRGLAWLGLLAGVALAALALDFRLRLALALAVALALGLARRGGWLETWPQGRTLSFLGRISYSVFLIHFSVCLLANALFARLGLESPQAAALFMVLAWGLSTVAGAYFHRYVESAAPGWQLESRIGRFLKAARNWALGTPPLNPAEAAKKS